MRGAALVACAIALAAPAGAHAQAGGDFFTIGFSGDRPVRLTQVAATVAGGLRVDFHGDPETCAAVGRCGLSGTVAWAPGHRAELLFLELTGKGRRRAFGYGIAEDYPFDRPARAVTVARVQRESPAGHGLCADTGPDDLSLTFSGTNGTVTLGLADDETPDLLATRCGGPLLRDLRALLPSRRLTLAALRRGRRDVDLRADAPFRVAGLAGTVHSDLVLHLGKGRSRRTPATGSRPPQSSARTLQTAFRVERVSGAVDVTTAGEDDPALCSPLDACGLRGTTRLVPRVQTGLATLSAVTEKGSRRALRAALGLAPGGVRPGVQVIGGGVLRDRGELRQSMSRPGDPACTDTARLSESLLSFAASGTRLRVTYAPYADLRTRCPGPPLPATLATTTVPLRALAARRLVLHLRRGGAERGDGYRLRTTSDLTIVLHRTTISSRLSGAAGIIGG